MNFSTTIQRIEGAKADFPLWSEMVVERGDKKDWDLLHHLHYKAEKLGMGPHFWRLRLHDKTIGVLVTCCPKGLVKERHIAFPKLKPNNRDNALSNTHRFMFINQNFRVVSRNVIDPIFRSVGCGYRMLNLVARLEGLTYMEIQSSMSKYNLFAQRAGFSFVRPEHPNKLNKGLGFLRLHFESDPRDVEALIQEYERQSAYRQAQLLEACKAWYYRNSSLEKTGGGRERGEARVAAMNYRDTIKAVLTVTFSAPLYGVYVNPDRGRTDMPASLPLLAFDRQKPPERLVL